MKNKNVKNKKNTKNKKVKTNGILDINSTEQITMLLQIALAIYALSFTVASFFEESLFVICELLVGVLMFVIGYNNHKVFKRKYMTAIYVGLGIIIIASVLFA